LVDLSGQADVLVGYFVADLMRKLVVARAMLDAGAPPEEVARAAKVWGPRQRAFFTVLRRHEPARLRQLLADALEADARAKSGLGRPVRNLERFCTTLVD
jgi:DNA polymerase III delta subunit